MSTPIQGWYSDPGGSGRLRWWNGTAWTERLADIPANGSPLTAPSAVPMTPAPTPRRRIKTSSIVACVLAWVGVFVLGVTALALFVGSRAIPRAIEEEQANIDLSQQRVDDAQSALDALEQELEDLK